MGVARLTEVLRQIKGAKADTDLARRSLWNQIRALRQEIGDLANSVQGSDKFTLEAMVVEMQQAERDDAKADQFMSFFADAAARLDRSIAATHPMLRSRSQRRLSPSGPSGVRGCAPRG